MSQHLEFMTGYGLSRWEVVSHNATNWTTHLQDGTFFPDKVDAFREFGIPSFYGDLSSEFMVPDAYGKVLSE